MSSDEVEGYPCPKRIKIENNHRSVEKEEQHDLEQSTYCMDANRKSPNKPIYLLKGSLNFSENALGLDMENNGRERKSNKYDLMDFKPWIKEKLECKLLANELLSKKWNIENLEHNVIRDECLMKVNGHSSKAGLCDMRNVNKMSELKQVQEQLNTNIEEDNTNKNHNELKLNASLSSLNTDLFQMKASSQKIGTDDKWKKYQLLDVPFLCGINSTFCEIKNKDSKCLKISPAEENKNHYDNDNKPIEQTGNKDKKSLHSFPTLNLVKNIQAFKIPQNDFFVKGNIIKCSNSSNTLNSKMVSTISQEMEQKNFKNQTYVMQCENTDCSPNISAIGKRKFQNDKNIVNVDSVCFEFNESNHQSAHKQKTWASAEGEKISETNFRNVINSIKCNQMFAKKNIKKKELGNVEGDEDRESKLYLSVHTYVGSRTTQNGTFSNSSNILKRTQGKVRNEDVMFNIQETSVALISEVVRNRDLNINYDMHCVNYNRNLHESELKPPAGKIVKIKRYLSKSIVTKGNCPSSTTWDLSDPRDIDCTLKQKILIKLKIFHDVLLGGLRTRSGFLTKELLKYQENDIITGWFHLHEKLNSTEQYSITEVITSINDNSHIYLQDTISEQQNVNRIKSYFASFSYIINPSDPAEKEYIPVEKNLLYYRKQIQVNSHISNILKGNTEPQQKCITYPEFQKKSCSSLSKIPFFPIFDTYEKIPLSAYSEEMDQVPFVKQINSSNEKCLGGKTVTIKKNVHNAPATSNICVLPKFSTSIVNYNSELLPGSRRNKAKYSQEINTYSQYLENESKYIDFPNAGSNSGNIICCILDNDQCATLPFYCDSFRDKDVERKTEEGHCGSSLNDDTKKPFGEMDKILQDGTVRSSEVSNSNICSKVQREEIMAFSVYEDTQTDRNLCTPNSKPMLMKQSLEDLQEVGEISSGQNHVINKSHHPMILYGSRSTNLILSYSKDESVLCVASQNKLVPCLSIMDNGYSENMTDQHLPSESKNISEFELKSTFDLVLEELCMFHEISKEHENKLPKVETNIIQENPSTLTDSGRIGENLKSISPTRACISFPISASMAGQNISKNNQSSFKRKILNRDVKQDTPHECCPSIVPDQELLYSLPEEGYVDSSSKNQLQWNPVLLSHMFMKERSDSLQKERGNCLSHEIIRVQPLKTCRGPIRIGLSRKAKPKKLHPYLK
ncbi:RAD51-associated protein 2 [Carettochelys insculpta]|uniref:RAD51-associated protein 2 n=1 Tax=Carettochelys insculpta TaxID=44489 RepID=UPI003EBBA37D